MEHIRKAIVQAHVVCTEYDPLVPSRIIDENEYSGTCFRVDSSLFPFGEKVLFLTNFHVCDNADDRVVHLRTAGMGKNALTGYVEAVVPQLDCAVISLSEEHEKWFLDEDPQDWIDNITIAPLRTTRITTKTQKVSTIGFPQGLEEQLSSGWLAGRGSDDMDMLQLNISINSGNSGGPLFDKSGKVIGICTATLNESEAIAFAVPIYSVLNYFDKFYETPFGRFPQWGLDLMPMTDAFAEQFGIDRVGAVVHNVEEGSCCHNVLSKGDVLHSIESGSFKWELDRFGLIHDNTRGSKITINNTEFLMRLTPGDIHMDITRKKPMTVSVMPTPIDYKVVDNYKEWNPIKTYSLGPITMQTLSKTLITGDNMPARKVVELVEILKKTKCMQELIIITHVKPRSYVNHLEVDAEFNIIHRIGRRKVKDMKHCIELMEDVKKRWEDGDQKRICIGTNKGDVWLTLGLLGIKRKR
tara:strand:+ start:2841 stop:4247 length:1407 start_codon:yes stop_codon:yes gene_type:complete